MIQEFVNKYFFNLLIFTLIFGIILYDLIGFDYTDELCALALFILFIFWMFRTPDWRINKAFLITICIFIFYLCYSFAINSNSKTAILADFTVQIKPYLAFFCVYSMAPNFSRIQKDLLKKISLILWFCLLPIGLLGLINMQYLIDIMGVPAYFAAAVIAVSLTYLFCSDFTTKDKCIFLILLSLGLISGRSKFYGFFVLAIVIIVYFSNVNHIKLNFKNIIILFFTFGIMLFVARNKIELYFMQGIVGDLDKNEIARYVLYATSIDIFKDYVPFGSGFASFGTFYSGEYYSNIYAKYGIDNVWGMTKNAHSFIADTFYPSLAQFGIVGLYFYSAFWIHILKKSFKSQSAKQLILTLLIVSFMGIEGIADSTFTTHRGFFILMFLGLVLSETKISNNKELKNESLTN
ncbi:MAG: O-antigen ligase domain-containing protein [Parabacteroides johnsonii]|uniref:O-antigen ligase domain-containing protein n=2 Tax=Parabacteroides hominis TaxID=2763057 RepID=A0ABR7DIR1_9BACT|nr:O-antigen ligase domain-containing protein [Parabacteroides hominis]MBD9167446.1 O-antigen ligase domain-containing protein [Parabacteroides johnsonii]